MSPCRIEETWRLWRKFLDDYSQFEDWLKMAERTAANPNSADVLYTVAKEELKKFEVSVEVGRQKGLKETALWFGCRRETFSFFKFHVTEFMNFELLTLRT